jgi:hypothetical protein
MTEYKNFQPLVATADVSISSGQTASAALDLMGGTLCGIYLPASMVGTSLTFQAASSASGSYQTVQKNGSDMTLSFAASKYIVLNPSDFSGIRFLKIVSSATETATVSLTLALRSL